MPIYKVLQLSYDLTMNKANIYQVKETLNEIEQRIKESVSIWQYKVSIGDYDTISHLVDMLWTLGEIENNNALPKDIREKALLLWSELFAIRTMSKEI